MTIAVVDETRAFERRVALVPSLVSRLTDVGQEVVVEPGAGEAAGFTDDSYRVAGATVDADALDGADVALSVQLLTLGQVGRLAPGAITVSFFPSRRSLS